MKKILLFILIWFCGLGLKAQFTNTGAKFLLNYQTDSKGLEHFGNGVPTYTPEDRFDTYTYRDTVTNNVYDWNDATNEWECFYFFKATTPVNVVGPPAVNYDRAIWYNTTDDSLYMYNASAWTTIGSGGGGSGTPDTLFLSVGPGDGVELVTGDSIMILSGLGLDATRSGQRITITPDFSEFTPYNGQLADTTNIIIYNTLTGGHMRMTAAQLNDYFIDAGPGANIGIRVETDYSSDDANTDYLRGVSPLDSIRIYNFDGTNYIFSSSDLFIQSDGAIRIGSAGADSITLTPSNIPLNNTLDSLLGIDPISGKIQQRAISTISGGGGGGATTLGGLTDVSTTGQDNFSVIRSDGTNWTAQNLGSNHSLRQHSGIVAHIGDSNTNGRPGWRDAYLQEWFGEDELFEGWTSYNIANNGSTLASWATETATVSDSILIDACPPLYGCGYEVDPGVIPYRIVNGDSLGKQPDVVLICLGTNDLNSPANRASIGTEANLRANLKTLVQFVLDSTGAFVMLRMPQPFVDEDFLGITQWVDSLEVIEANRRIKTVYREWIGRHPRVDVYDTHQLFPDSVWRKDLHGLDPVTNGQMIADALHSSDLGYKRICQGMSHQLSNGKQLFPTISPLPWQFPEDFFRNGTWGANLYIKTGTAYNDDSQNIEVYASQQQSVFGRYYNSINDDGEPYIRKRDVLKASKLSPEATYQAFLNLGGAIYLYHYETGNTHTIENPAQTQWVTASPPNYAQVSADFTGTGTLPDGEYLIYSKTDWPGSGTIGPGVNYNASQQGISFSGGDFARIGISNAATYTGALRVEQATAGNIIHLKGTGSGTNGIFMDMDGTGYVLDAQLDNAQATKGLEITMNKGDSYLFNSSFTGVNFDFRHALDNPTSTGLKLRLYNNRGSQGSNTLGNNDIVVFDVAGGTPFATDIPSTLIKAQISGINTQGFVLSAPSGQTANIINTTNGGDIAFRVEGDNEVVLDSTIWLDAEKETGILRWTAPPESTATAGPGSLYLRSSGGAGTSLYIKESGTGNTGWKKVLTSTQSYAEMYVDTSQTSTVSLTASGPYVAASTATAGLLSDFSYSGGVLTYVGTETKTFSGNLSISFSGINNAQIKAAFYKNGSLDFKSQLLRKLGTGGDVGSASANLLISLSENDTVDLRFISDTTGTLTIESMNLTLTAVN